VWHLQRSRVFGPAAFEIHRRLRLEKRSEEISTLERTLLCSRCAHFSALIYECELFENMSITSQAGKFDFRFDKQREAKEKKNQFQVRAGTEAKKKAK
jgi:hypothetical protein